MSGVLGLIPNEEINSRSSPQKKWHLRVNKQNLKVALALKRDKAVDMQLGTPAINQGLSIPFQGCGWVTEKFIALPDGTSFLSSLLEDMEGHEGSWRTWTGSKGSNQESSPV